MKEVIKRLLENALKWIGVEKKNANDVKDRINTTNLG